MIFFVWMIMFWHILMHKCIFTILQVIKLSVPILPWNVFLLRGIWYTMNKCNSYYTYLYAKVVSCSSWMINHIITIHPIRCVKIWNDTMTNKAGSIYREKLLMWHSRKGRRESRCFGYCKVSAFGAERQERIL